MTLCPSYFNVGFSLIAWYRNEDPRNKFCQSLRYLPFVFIQFYPQYRALRVISNGLSKRRWISDLEEYEAREAHLEGVIESSSTVFLQTAIIGSMLAYETSKILDLSKRNCEQQCSENFENVLNSTFCDSISQCSTKCFQEFLSLDTNQFYNSIQDLPYQKWIEKTDITRFDVRNSQAFHYFVGEQTVFIPIFIISTIATSIGFANFLKAGFVRYTDSFISKRFFV